MTKYTFRTIVAPDAVRAGFTVLRDGLGSSDKELMQAIWNLTMRNIEEVQEEVQALKVLTARAKEEMKEIKAAAKLRMKEEKLNTKEVVDVESIIIH
jgi:hypothetical protein